MTPRDVPGHLQIGSLFPWLAQLSPAGGGGQTSCPAPAPAPLTTRPTAVDLPRAA